MSAIKPILRELQQAALKGGVHARDRLHRVADNMSDHLDGSTPRRCGRSCDDAEE